MRGQSKSPMRQTNGSRGNIGMENEGSSDWLTHYFLEWNPYRSVMKIYEIIDSNASKFKKVVVYAKNDQNAREIYNTESKTIGQNSKVLMLSSNKKNELKDKYFNFILEENRLLITSLTPGEIFQEAGKLDIEDVNFIINQVAPKDPQRYLDRMARIPSINGKNKGTMITLVETKDEIQKIQNELRINVQIYNDKNKSQKNKNIEKPIQQNSKSPLRQPPQNTTNNRSQDVNKDRSKTPVQDRNVSPRNTEPKNYYSINRRQQEIKEDVEDKRRSISRNNKIDRQKNEPREQNRSRSKTPSRAQKQKYKTQLQQVRKNVIGLNTTFTSGFLLNLEAVYVDHTATNRPYQAVEEMIEHAKLLAANPHTEFSHYGEYSTNLMKYARDSLLKSFNASPEEYVVLPTGAGSTGAIEKAVLLLEGLKQSDKRWDQPQIFITPYEHHSNILPWVEFYEKIEVLSHNKLLSLDMKKIAQQITNCKSENIIVSVSAASNVTSKLTHLKELNAVIKKARAKKTIVFGVDCAAFCCHQQLDLQIYDEIDFAFLSPHKNLGGAESCGVLVGRNSVMSRVKPTFPGGGTVKFVKGYTKEDVMYETDNFSREIAGTPPYFGFYRAALSFQLLTNVIGYDFIHYQEYENTKTFFDGVKDVNEKMKRNNLDTKIQIYGDRDLKERANVVTFNIVYTENGTQKGVHQNFVSLILTDIFGIQVRSGCFCAGPHGIKLLNLSDSNIRSIEEEVEAGLTVNKPGYVRIDLAFYLQKYEVEYIVNAIYLIAQYWRNYKIVYTISNEGQIYLPKIMANKRDPPIYSLLDLKKASSRVRQEERNHDKKLREREETLARQLSLGEDISRNPVEFMKRAMNNEFNQN